MPATGQRVDRNWYSPPRCSSSTSGAEKLAGSLPDARSTLRSSEVICEYATRIQSQETTMASSGRQATPRP